MPNVPKIVRQRLQMQNASVASHPDPDVLTALAEQSLSQRERASVLDHVSRCGDCREVLALALPPSELMQVVAAKPSSGRLSWPTLRWAFASAGLAAIALFASLQYARHNRSMEMAKYTPQPATIQPSVELYGQQAQDRIKPTEEQSPQASLTQNSTALVIPGKKNIAASPAPKTELAKDYLTPGVSRTLPHGPRQITQWQQQGTKAQQVPSPAAPLNWPAAQPQASGAVAVDVRVPAANDSAELQSQTENKNQAFDSSTLAANQVSSKPRESDAEVSRAKSAPPMPAPAASQVRVQDSAVQSLVTASSPAWTIVSGRLQRSFDHGNTWQDVNVTGASDARASLEIAVAARKSAEDSMRKDKTEQSAMFFRAVAANAADVWAGGNGAVLYHSVDAGSHWSRVIPSSSTATLTGDILTVEFPDSQNGKIMTSTGEVWITANHGATWQKE